MEHRSRHFVLARARQREHCQRLTLAPPIAGGRKRRQKLTLVPLLAAVDAMSVDFAMDSVDEMVIYVRKVDPKTNVRSITQRDLHKISLDYFRKNPDLKIRKNPDLKY